MCLMDLSLSHGSAGFHPFSTDAESTPAHCLAVWSPFFPPTRYAAEYLPRRKKAYPFGGFACFFGRPALVQLLLVAWRKKTQNRSKHYLTEEFG